MDYYENLKIKFIKFFDMICVGLVLVMLSFVELFAGIAGCEGNICELDSKVNW